MESFATSSSLTLFGTLPNVLLCSPFPIHQQVMLFFQPHTLVGIGLIIIMGQPQPSITNGGLLYTQHELIWLITSNAVRHHIISQKLMMKYAKANLPSVLLAKSVGDLAVYD